MKRIETVLETTGTTLNTQTFELQGSQKKKGKRKGWRKYLKTLQLKTSLICERKQLIKSRKHRESHTGKIQGETWQDILIKLSKIKYKEKILRAAREKQQIAYKGIPIRLTADFSAETLQARREWQDIFKVMKGKILQPRLLYPARISFKFDGEIKTLQTSKS